MLKYCGLVYLYHCRQLWVFCAYYVLLMPVILLIYNKIILKNLRYLHVCKEKYATWCHDAPYPQASLVRYIGYYHFSWKAIKIAFFGRVNLASIRYQKFNGKSYLLVILLHIVTYMHTSLLAHKHIICTHKHTHTHTRTHTCAHLWWRVELIIDFVYSYLPGTCISN